jgi:hypothetical protein
MCASSESTGGAIVVDRRTQINDGEYFMKNSGIRIKEKLINMLTTTNILCAKNLLIHSVIYLRLSH